MKKSFFWSEIVDIYGQVFSVLRKNPTVWILFAIIGLFDAIALTLLYLAPSPPLSHILAPIIRTLWGEPFLHYPDNFLLLPKLFNHAHFLILTFVGVFITGIVIKKIEAQTQGTSVTTVSAAGAVGRRYIALLSAWIVTYGIFTVTLRFVLPILPHNVFIQASVGFMIGLVIQSMFAFILPGILLMNWGFFTGLWKGLLFGMRNLHLTAVLIFVPMFFVMALSVSKLFVPVMVRVHTPEYVLWLLAGGILLSLFVDILVTSSTTLLFLRQRSDQ